MPVLCNVHTHECIAHCLPTAAGECACPAQDLDIRSPYLLFYQALNRMVNGFKSRCINDNH